jgi:uncharacterized protein YebE (UPF0316 family)
MTCRVLDVSLGTVRTLMVVKGYKYSAAILGFIEVTIWVVAIRHIMLNLDNLWNIFGYSLGFALGTILGITIENKFGKGFVQMYVISKHHTDKIANALRSSKVGVTILPGEGVRGGVAILVVLVNIRRKNEVIKLVEKIDSDSFISVQTAVPYRGFIHSRK